jgi:hypothetical protein
MFGSGPFFLGRDRQLKVTSESGGEVDIRVDVAVGQWGDLMVELVRQTSPEPTILTKTGSDNRPFVMHHLCMHVPDLDLAISRAGELGFSVAMTCQRQEGGRIIFLDTMKTLGHFVELCERTGDIAFLYDSVRRASELAGEETPGVRDLSELSSVW